MNLLMQTIAKNIWFFILGIYVTYGFVSLLYNIYCTSQFYLFKSLMLLSI